MISQAGYFEVDGLKSKDTNASQAQAYDRMFVKENNYFKVATNDQGQGVGDVFRPFDFVFRREDHLQYKEEMIKVYGGTKDLRNDAAALENYFLHYWCRNQISDHFPIWFELTTDSSVAFLSGKKAKLQG